MALSPKKVPSRAHSFSRRRQTSSSSSSSSTSASVNGHSCQFLQTGRHGRWRTWGNTGRKFLDKKTSWKFTLLPNTSRANKWTAGRKQHPTRQPGSVLERLKTLSGRPGVHPSPALLFLGFSGPFVFSFHLFDLYFDILSLNAKEGSCHLREFSGKEVHRGPYIDEQESGLENKSCCLGLQTVTSLWLSRKQVGVNPRFSTFSKKQTPCVFSTSMARLRPQERLTSTGGLFILQPYDRHCVLFFFSLFSFCWGFGKRCLLHKTFQEAFCTV